MFLSKLIVKPEKLNVYGVIKRLKNFIKDRDFSFNKFSNFFLFSEKNQIFLKQSAYIKNLLFLNKLEENKKKQSLIYYNNLVTYIFNIRVTRNNMFINLADRKGNTKFLYSTSSFINKKMFRKKSTNQFSLLVKALQNLIKKTKHLQKHVVSIHFKNTQLFQETFLIKILKKFFIIKAVVSFNSNPHNGCRPRKIKRIKSRLKRRK